MNLADTSSTRQKMATTTLGPLDRLAIAYLALPLAIFIGGWFELWVALPLMGCMIYAMMPVYSQPFINASRLPVSFLQISVAIVVSIGWTVLGGADHILFANADWHIRDAVLHDLVTSPWPVGYGLLDGHESMLRAPIAFYLPAALAGKVAGLTAAHLAMSAWTAMGATLFLLQILSLTPSRWGVALTVVMVIVLFSGLDIVGSLLNDGPRFRQNWNVTTHLEWWAGEYQYSSFTTQLFWVPNHALGGWLLMGLLCRCGQGSSLDLPLAMTLVALALWSPLTAIGAMPFLFWRLVAEARHGRLSSLVHPRVWLPALVVGIAIAAYLLLDSDGVQKGIAVGRRNDDAVVDLLRQTQFFLLEAGFIGAAVLAIRPSTQVGIALIVLAVLPLVYLGPGNDLVMRGSVPSLAVLAIGAAFSLISKTASLKAKKKRSILAVLLLVGSITPLEEFARAAMLPAWPINLHATLIGASCGGFAPHYVARLGHQLVTRILRQPHPLLLGPQGPAECNNPAFELMQQAMRKNDRSLTRPTSATPMS